MENKKFRVTGEDCCPVSHGGERGAMAISELRISGMLISASAASRNFTNEAAGRGNFTELDAHCTPNTHEYDSSIRVCYSITGDTFCDEYITKCVSFSENRGNCKPEIRN